MRGRGRNPIRAAILVPGARGIFHGGAASPGLRVVRKPDPRQRQQAAEEFRRLHAGRGSPLELRDRPPGHPKDKKAACLAIFASAIRAKLETQGFHKSGDPCCGRLPAEGRRRGQRPARGPEEGLQGGALRRELRFRQGDAEARCGPRAEPGARADEGRAEARARDRRSHRRRRQARLQPEAFGRARGRGPEVDRGARHRRFAPVLARLASSGDPLPGPLPRERENWRPSPRPSPKGEGEFETLSPALSKGEGEFATLSPALSQGRGRTS
jgi:hypothetical protein